MADTNDAEAIEAALDQSQAEE